MNYTLTFTTDELNIILGALGDLPAKASMNVIMSIQKQAQQQGQQDEPVVEEVEES